MALVGEDLAVEEPQPTAHGDVLGHFPFAEPRIRREQVPAPRKERPVPPVQLEKVLLQDGNLSNREPAA